MLKLNCHRNLVPHESQQETLENHFEASPAVGHRLHGCGGRQQMSGVAIILNQATDLPALSSIPNGECQELHPALHRLGEDLQAICLGPIR